MQTLRSATNVSGSEGDSVSAKTLRLWCAPELILAVTELHDEAMLMPQIINQARHSGAKIILAHLVAPDAIELQCWKQPVHRSRSPIQQARTELDRMARHLRWLGFTCEPLVVSGRPEIEIPVLARSLSVDRVIVGLNDNPELSLRHIPTLAEKLLPWIEVPICIVGRCVSLSSRMFIRNIMLAVPPGSDCEVPLAFGSRLAQELRAKLTVFHAFRQEGTRQETIVPTHEAFIASLPSPGWREAELFCPTEITLRKGDPADEILKHCSSTDQDLIILCSRGRAISERKNWRSSVTYSVLAGARCPVIVLDQRNASSIVAVQLTPQKMPVQRDISIEDPLAETSNTSGSGMRSTF